MTSCRSRWWLAVVAASLAVELTGCVTGHLLATARRREYAREMEAPVDEEDGGRVLRYTAEVTDDAGASCGTVVRTVRLAAGEPVPSRRELTRVRTAPWVYPLVPLGLAADAVMVPVLVVLSPMLLVTGD